MVIEVCGPLENVGMATCIERGHGTGVVMRYFLASNNATALPCKHHETGVKMQQNVVFCLKRLCVNAAYV